VGVEHVRELLYLRSHIHATKAMLVTTAEFTRSAIELAAQYQWELELADGARVFEWIKAYQPRSVEPNQTHLESSTFYSCFLSYSHADESFAASLYAALRRGGIAVWYAPNDMMPGEKIVDQIEKAISSADKLLLVLSVRSIASNWVETELRRACRREIAEKQRVLFPVSLLSMSELQRWSCFDSDLGTDLAALVRQYFILDFIGWEDRAIFERQVVRLLTGLKAPSAA
jgi:hypothetical protein